MKIIGVDIRGDEIEARNNSKGKHKGDEIEEKA